MSNINNMGGIVSAEYLFSDELYYATNGAAAIIKPKPGCQWRRIPITGPVAAPTISAEFTDAGLMYTHTATLRISRNAISAVEVQVLGTITHRGCALRCQDTNGQYCVYCFPFLGTLTESNGKSAADFSGYELNLTGKSLYPQLSLIEL